MDKNLFDAFEKLENEYDEYRELVGAVEVMSDHKLYSFYLKKIKNLQEFVLKYKKYKDIIDEVNFTSEIAVTETEQFETEKLRVEADKLLTELKNDFTNLKNKEAESVEIEICAKDSDFRVELITVFEKYSMSNSYDFEKENENDETALVKISGENVYKNLSIFSGKIKKILRGEEYFANVVVLKKTNFDIIINEEDLIIQTSKSSGAGGQHINKTESAVKIIHVPTGIFAECQEERSQTKNKEKAMQFLLKKITQNSEEKSKKNKQSQRNSIKNKLFSTTPTIVFDFDANKVIAKNDKSEYKLKEILDGKLELIINNRL